MCNGRWRVFAWKLPCGDPGFSLWPANSIYKAFSVYTIRSSIPLLSKIHILISCNFFFVFIPLQGSKCPPVTSVEKKKSHSAYKLDHLFFIQTDPFCIPICRPNGDFSAVRETPLPHVTPQPFLHVVVGMTIRASAGGCSRSCSAFPLAKSLPFLFSIYHPEKEGVN